MWKPKPLPRPHCFFVVNFPKTGNSSPVADFAAVVTAPALSLQTGRSAHRIGFPKTVFPHAVLPLVANPSGIRDDAAQRSGGNGDGCGQ
jgi:hypothetical protein